MKYGFVLSWGTPAEVLEMAAAAEAHGWDGVFTWDGMSIGSMEVYDPWVLMGAIAGVTRRVKIGAMILPLSRRRPWKVAKEAVTIDHLSNGRLVIPVGLGTVDDRGFTGVNTDSAGRKERAGRLDECLEILATAQTGEVFDYSGTHFQVEQMQLLPRPVQERIPVWAVGAWPKPKSLARAVKWDGIIISDMTGEKTMWEPPTPDVIRDVAAWVQEHRTAEGPFDLIVEGTTRDANDTEYTQAAAEAGATWFIESQWDDEETPADLMARIKAGPPRAS